MTKVYDLGDLDTKSACDAGARIEYKHPVTKQGLGMYVHVVGKDGSRFNAYVERSADEDRRKAYDAAQAGKPVEYKPFATSQAEGIDLAVHCTLKFSCDPIPADERSGQAAREGGDFLWVRGEKLVFNEANARKFFNDFPEFFRQTNTGIVSLENFIKV